MNIYLAGKIASEDDWRETLVPDVRLPIREKGDDYPTWEITKGVLWGNNYTGPYFASDPNQKYGKVHEIPLATHRGCSDDNQMNYIVQQCTSAILASDLVFAYINHTECYGTLVEIGIAIALEIPLGIAFDSALMTTSSSRHIEDCLVDDFWFARSVAAWHSEIGDRYHTVFDALQEFIISCGGEIIEKPFAGEDRTYAEYLQSDHWKQFAAEAKERAGNRCQLCNADGELHTHHRTYDRLGEELPEDVVVLCADCHAKFHDK